MEARRAGEFILPAWSCRRDKVAQHGNSAYAHSLEFIIHIRAPPSELLCSIFPVCLFLFTDPNLNMLVKSSIIYERAQCRQPQCAVNYMMQLSAAAAAAALLHITACSQV
jgi:hypothetical protein